MTIDSPFNVSSEESVGFLRVSDQNVTSEIDGTDLTTLFEESAIPLLKLFRIT